MIVYSKLHEIRKTAAMPMCFQNMKLVLYCKLMLNIGHVTLINETAKIWQDLAFTW